MNKKGILTILLVLSGIIIGIAGWIKGDEFIKGLTLLPVIGVIILLFIGITDRYAKINNKGDKQ